MNVSKRIIIPVSLLVFGLAATAAATPSNPIAPPLSFNSSSGYYNPPSWSSMVMVNITFDGIKVGWEPVSYNFTVGPVLRAAPANGDKTTFDPSQPWSVLNGTAFNRQLGWYDNIQNDFHSSHRTTLDGNFLWIEKVGGSQQLKTYFVAEADNPNGPYTPIFGTDGSSTKWKWDGFMDHNAYAVDLADITSPNQLFTADYKLYIGDAAGNEVMQVDQVTPRFGSLNLTWSWIGPADVPEPATCVLLLAGLAGMLARRRK